VTIFRLPGVFGKWCRPNYNSVVATFCHNLSRNLPIRIDDSKAPLVLVHVDAVMRSFLKCLDQQQPTLKELKFAEVIPEYRTTVGEVAEIIERFRNSRESLISERTGQGLVRDLYGTYLSYLSADQFVYQVPVYEDPRGVFSEMLKTKDSGQFSYFSIKPGLTRGSHYHHRKAEKFLPLNGKVKMRFRHLVSGETSILEVEGGNGTIIETVPGWVHDITNIGKEEAWVMLWANEAFDRKDPDCIPCEV
jgi:UDP-2-acetamido-2,6-beta-L-arabino-hexul-4-ose reductase